MNPSGEIVDRPMWCFGRSPSTVHNVAELLLGWSGPLPLAPRLLSRRQRIVAGFDGYFARAWNFATTWSTLLVFSRTIGCFARFLKV